MKEYNHNWFTKPRINGCSLLGVLNIILLQWFFVRLEGVLYHDGRKTTYQIIGPIVPLTGWWSKYIRLQSPRENK